jgi:hypothetical protein
MESNGIKWNQGIKKPDCDFYCEDCDYKCCYQSLWLRHISTSKHISSVDGIKNGIKEQILDKSDTKHSCECGRSYSSKSSLGKHKKSCQYLKSKTSETSEEKMDVYDLVKYLMKENSELKSILIDQSNKMGDVTMELAKNVSSNSPQIATQNNTNNSNNNTVNNTNSHNKAFNLNFFLNETCKNAMNITDFVESIKLQLSDFMDVGKNGYVQGISNIIVKKLNDLDETVRPIHCTDQKRETFYVKDENKWEKEEDDMVNIRKMIKKVTCKNEKLMWTFKEKFPDFNDPDSKNSDKYSKFVIEALGGEGDNIKEKEEKIIRNIAKNVTIKK